MSSNNKTRELSASDQKRSNQKEQLKIFLEYLEKNDSSGKKNALEISKNINLVRLISELKDSESEEARYVFNHVFFRNFLYSQFWTLNYKSLVSLMQASSRLREDEQILLVDASHLVYGYESVSNTKRCRKSGQRPDYLEKLILIAAEAKETKILSDLLFAVLFFDNSQIVSLPKIKNPNKFNSERNEKQTENSLQDSYYIELAKLKSKFSGPVGAVPDDLKICFDVIREMKPNISRMEEMVLSRKIYFETKGKIGEYIQIGEQNKREIESLKNVIKNKEKLLGVANKKYLDLEEQRSELVKANGKIKELEFQLKEKNDYTLMLDAECEKLRELIKKLQETSFDMIKQKDNELNILKESTKQINDMNNQEIDDLRSDLEFKKQQIISIKDSRKADIEKSQEQLRSNFIKSMTDSINNLGWSLHSDDDSQQLNKFELDDLYHKLLKLASELGLEKIGEPYQKVMFNPMIHDCCEAEEKDFVTVERIGWKKGDTIIQKAECFSNEG